MKRFSVLFLMMICLLGFGLLLTSCDNGTTSSGGGGVVGTWVGQGVIDGLQIVTTVVFRSDFTFTQRDFLPALGVTVEASGTFSVTGNIVTATFIGGSMHGMTVTATVTGNTMTDADGFIFIRQ